MFVQVAELAVCICVFSRAFCAVRRFEMSYQLSAVIQSKAVKKMEIVICVASSCFRLEAKSEELFCYLFLSILAVIPGCKGRTLKKKKKNFLLCRCQCLAYAHTSCVGDSTSQPKQKVRWPSAMHAGSVGVWGRLMTIFYFILKAMSNVVLNIKIDGPQSCRR